MNEQPQGQIAWVVHTHEHRERSVDWYWAFGLIAIVGAVLALFFGDVLFAIVIILGVGSVLWLAARGPRTHWVRVDARGLSMDGTLYKWSAVTSFFVEPVEPEQGKKGRLLVTTTGLMHPQLVIPVEDDTRARNLRTMMSKFAQEEEQEPHVGVHLAELLGL